MKNYQDTVIFRKMFIEIWEMQMFLSYIWCKVRSIYDTMYSRINQVKFDMISFKQNISFQIF